LPEKRHGLTYNAVFQSGEDADSHVVQVEAVTTKGRPITGKAHKDQPYTVDGLLRGLRGRSL